MGTEFSTGRRFPCRWIAGERSSGRREFPVPKKVGPRKVAANSGVAKRNARLAQVVGSNLHLHLVAHADADEILSHLAGDVSQDFVAVGQGHTEHGPWQHLCYRAL